MYVFMLEGVALAVIFVVAFVLLSNASVEGDDPAECRQARDIALNHMYAKYVIPFDNPVYGSWDVKYLTPEGLVGASTWGYTQGEWEITVSYPIVLEPVYTVVIDYAPQHLGIPYHLYWEGTVDNGVVTEIYFWLAE